MAVVIAALLPVFLLIVLGFALRRSLMRLDTQWHGLERLTYYVLFPTLLIQTLVQADLASVPVAGVGGALFLAALVMTLLCLALKPLFSRLAIDGPAFTSIFQGATRWQTYVALAVSSNLFGQTGLALASVAMVAIIPLVNVLSVWVLAQYASPERQSVRTGRQAGGSRLHCHLQELRRQDSAYALSADRSGPRATRGVLATDG